LDASRAGAENYSQSSEPWYPAEREERRAVEEGGGGESEGFELAEEQLIEHTSHGDEHAASRILQDAYAVEEDSAGSEYSEPDEESKPD